MTYVESHLKVWRERLNNNFRNKELTHSDISSLFREKELCNAFFSILDRDQNGFLNYEEWIGTFTKSVDPSKMFLVDWFVDKFEEYTEISGEKIISKSEFIEILTDSEFGYRFSLLIQIKSGKKIKPIELMSSIEIISTLSTDGKWLSWLKYQFIAVAKKSNLHQTDTSNNNSLEMKISLDDFLQGFDFKETFLAHRLFAYLDDDSSGYLSMREFINGLEIIVNGSDDDRMEFLFKVFDINNDGLIDFEEMKMLLKCCMDETPYVDLDQTMEELAAYLFTKTDKDDSGDISFEELKNAFIKYDVIFSQLTFSTSIWIKPKYIKPRHGKKAKCFYKANDFIENNIPLVIFWSLYITIHLICSLYAVFSYIDSSIWVIIARFFGASLNFNCSLVLVLMLRKHFTWLRTKGGNKLLPLDEFIDMHKLIGVIILVEALIHTIAHFINLYFVCIEKQFNFLEVLLTNRLNLGYPTGVLEIVLYLVIFICAMPFVRRGGYFQIFHWCHMLTIPWLFIMTLHGKKFWIWILVPLFCYTLENILRYRKISSETFGETYIEQSYVLPSKVTHLVIKKPPKFRYNPGDYIFINIPTIAKYEWHPFSISSAPERSDYLWLHIRAVGNWTNKLHSYSMSTKFDLSFTSQNRSRQSNPGVIMRTTVMNRLNSNDIMEKNEHQQHVKVNFAFKNNSLENIDRDEVKVTNEMIKNEIELNEHKGILKKQNEIKQMSHEIIENRHLVSDKNFQDSINSENNYIPKASESTPFKNIQNLDETNAEIEENNFVHYSQTKSIKEIESSTTNKMIEDDNKIELSVIVSEKEQDCVIPIVAFQPQSKITNEHQKTKFLDQVKKLSIVQDKKRDKDSVSDNQILDESIDSDILGYHKMYSKSARVNMETIGLDNLWRLRLYIDGPYGTPSYSIFDSSHAVLIGAGIGITPFASILQSLMQRYRQQRAKCPNCNINLNKHLCSAGEHLQVKKVDFIWITREQRSLEWFISMLSQMEIEQRKANVETKKKAGNSELSMFMESHLYVTSAKKRSDLKSISLHLTLDAIYSKEDNCLNDGLRKRTHYGRPNWDIVMQNLIRQQKGKIDVFYCGPPALSKILTLKCKEYGFSFCREIF